MKTTQADFNFWLVVQYKNRPAWATDKKFQINADIDSCINARANLNSKKKTNDSLHNTLYLLKLARRNIETGANKEHKTLREFIGELENCPASRSREIIVKRFIRKMEKARPKQIKFR